MLSQSRRHRRKPWGFALALAAISYACGANAQSFRYDKFEGLFGEPVTTSATGKPQRASDVPATMEIISAEQIRHSGASDVPGLLRRLPGIDVYQSSPNGKDVSIRGYIAPMTGRVMVLVDGRQVYNDSLNVIAWNLLPVELDEIRQIEVIKGPQSALYGFNAAAGVINIITFNPLDTPVNSAMVRAGTGGYRELSTVVTAKPSERTAFRLSASGMNQADAGNQPDSISQAQLGSLMPLRRATAFNGAAELDNGDRLGLSGSYGKGAARRLLSAEPLNFYDTEWSVKGDYTARTELGLLSALAYHNNFNGAADLTGIPLLPGQSSVTMAGIEDLLKLDAANSVRLSTEYRHTEFTLSNYGTVFDNIWSVGGMWDCALSETLSLVNAVRYDTLILGRHGAISPLVPLTEGDFNRTLSTLSFNSGLVWRVDDRDTLRLTTGRGFNLPDVADFGSFVAPTLDGSAVIYGNPRVNPVEVWNTELSWDHRLPALDTTTRASLFYQTNRGILENDPNPQPNPLGVLMVPTVNYANSDTVGLELGAKGKIGSHWDWAANYTFQTLWDQLPSLAPTSFPAVSYRSSTPHHRLNAHAGYRDGDWEAGLDLNYVTRYRMPDFAQYVRSNFTEIRAMADLGNFVILQPRVAYHVTPSITAELSTPGLWPRKELPLGVVEPQVLVTLIGRW